MPARVTGDTGPDIGPRAEAVPGAEAPNGVPDVVYVALPPNARLAAQAVEPTLVMHPQTLKVHKVVLWGQYRLDGMPPGADACLGCFPPPAAGTGRREVRPGRVVLVVDRGQVFGRVRFGRLSGSASRLNRLTSAEADL